MPFRLWANKSDLVALAVVPCLLLTQFACNQANNVEARTNAKEQLEKPPIGVSQESGNTLTLDLVADQESLDLGVFALTAMLKNSSAKPISFLPWANPFEKNVTADFLKIVDRKTGGELLYRGIMVKRMPPKPSDYLSLAPQQAIENTIDLSRSYKFCAHQELKIVFSGAVYNQLSEPYKLQLSGLDVVLPNTFPDC